MVLSPDLVLADNASTPRVRVLLVIVMMRMRMMMMMTMRLTMAILPLPKQGTGRSEQRDSHCVLFNVNQWTEPTEAITCPAHMGIARP